MLQAAPVLALEAGCQQTAKLHECMALWFETHLITFTMLLCSSIDILGGNAWSYAAIPLIYVFMLLIRTGCLALFNISVFAWIRERVCLHQAAVQARCLPFSMQILRSRAATAAHYLQTCLQQAVTATGGLHHRLPACCVCCWPCLQGWAGQRFCLPAGQGCGAPSLSS
jgi:hypothetical protein